MHGLELGDRIRLAHAALQATADGVGADVLHIKGYASMPGLYRVDRVSTDADVLVRPEHLQRFLGALREHRHRPRPPGRVGEDDGHLPQLFQHAILHHQRCGHLQPDAGNISGQRR